MMEILVHDSISPRRQKVYYYFKFENLKDDYNIII